MQQIQDSLREAGGAAVVRNTCRPQRDRQTGIGPITVKVPKVRSRDGESVTYHSALVPPDVSKTKSLEAALAWLYLNGVSTGEISKNREALAGVEACVACLPLGGPVQATEWAGDTMTGARSL